MKLIPFDCINPETDAKLVFYINPDAVVAVSSGTLPGELSGPDGEALPVKASAIVLLNGQTLIVKDAVENVIKKLKGENNGGN